MCEESGKAFEAFLRENEVGDSYAEGCKDARQSLIRSCGSGRFSPYARQTGTIFPGLERELSEHEPCRRRILLNNMETAGRPIFSRFLHPQFLPTNNRP